MNKNAICLLVAFFFVSCVFNLAPAQSAAKKAEPAKLNHGTTVKHIERNITGAARKIEDKVEQRGVQKYKAKVKQEENKKHNK